VERSFSVDAKDVNLEDEKATAFGAVISQQLAKREYTG
jgi:hypothetical protein